MCLLHTSHDNFTLVLLVLFDNVMKVYKTFCLPWRVEQIRKYISPKLMCFVMNSAKFSSIQYSNSNISLCDCRGMKFEIISQPL